jgi:nucleotide-binding universal stress UspA family protein
MIKRILVPLDSSPYCAAALNLACIMGKQFDAEITGMVILDIHGIEKSIGPVPAGGLYYAEQLEKSKLEDAKKRIHKLLSQFENKCKKEGIKYKIAERQGSPSNQIIKDAIFYDAVIIGIRTFFHFEAQDDAGDSLEKILDDSITPIYAVSENFADPITVKDKLKVLITFDGSHPSARALQRFAQFDLPIAMETTLLNCSENKEKADYLLLEAENYLKCHGFNKIQKVWTDEHIIDVIENQYIDKIDFIVLGANSKKGILDFVLGSLTERLVKIGTKSLLIG